MASGDLAAVGYDPTTLELHVLFHTGTLYAYSGVPGSVHSGLMAAGSKGEFFHYAIRDRYPSRRIE